MPDTNGPNRPSEKERYLTTETVRRTPGGTVIDFGAKQIDMVALRGYRLERIQEQLRSRDLPAILCYDPINVRYATGLRNMQNYSFHTQIRGAFIPDSGQATVWEYGGSEHLGASLETIAEVRTGSNLVRSANLSVVQLQHIFGGWAAQIRDLLTSLGAAGRPRLAIDRQVSYTMGHALIEIGIELVDGHAIMSKAQSIKSDEEILCMSRSVAVTEISLNRIRESIKPGVTENQLWSILNEVNAAHGGDYVDTRLLSSGGRTNPWYQEATDKPVRSGELVAIDTDMIGPFGYDADISRTFYCGPGKPNSEQKSLYRIAWEHVHYNMDLIRPGISFRKLSELAFPVPEKYRLQQYGMDWHGIGLCGQWPNIPGNGLFNDDVDYDGVVEPGMALCIESYIGEFGGLEGVKLEQQVTVTDTGVQLLCLFPFEEDLLTWEI